MSILPSISKIFEKCLYDLIQIQVISDSILAKYQCGFQTGCNDCIMTLMEKWKKSVNNGGAFGAFTDLSKTFDCLSHELFIAKLDAYGFDKNTLKIIK